MVTEFQGSDPLLFVVSKNLHRRHLSESERAMLASKIAISKAGRPVANSSIELFSQAKVAETLNVSLASVKRAAKVRKYADPAVIEAVESGRATVSDAAAIAKEPKTVQQAAVAAQTNGTATTLRDGAYQSNLEVFSTGAEQSAAAEREAKPPKNGEPRFDEKKLDEAFGRLLRLVTARWEAYGKKPCKNYHRAKDSLGYFVKVIDEWRQER